MRISVMGLQGSGKSTQAKILSEKFNLYFISTGELAREGAKQDTPEGWILREAMEQGVLADDKVIAKLAREKLEETDSLNNFVMDGYPRRLSQIEAWDPKLEKVFYIEVPDEEIMKRLLSRGRSDDNERAIKTRLEVYHKETQPVIEHYQSQGILTKIDGLGSIDEVTDRIIAHLKNG